MLELIKTIEAIHRLVDDAGSVKLKNGKLSQTALRDLVTALVDCVQFMEGFCKPSFLGMVFVYA